MYNKELIFTKLSFESKEQLFDFISEKLLEKNIVKTTFCNAIKNREKIFPTGLLFVKNCGVAIPHTEVIHCLENSISFLKLEKPLVFLDMEEGNQNIDVQYVFVLTLTDPDAHIDILQKLFTLISNEDFFTQLSTKKNVEELYIYFSNKFKE